MLLHEAQAFYEFLDVLAYFHLCWRRLKQLLCFCIERYSLSEGLTGVESGGGPRCERHQQVEKSQVVFQLLVAQGEAAE